MHFSSREERDELGTSWKRAEHQRVLRGGARHWELLRSSRDGGKTNRPQKKKKRGANSFKEAFSGIGYFLHTLGHTEVSRGG